MDANVENAGAGGCPVAHGRHHANRDWWPDSLRLEGLNQHSPRSNPLGEAFNYTKGTHSMAFGTGVIYHRTLQQNANAGARGTMSFQATSSALLFTSQPVLSSVVYFPEPSLA